jgi:hypothetical protein
MLLRPNVWREPQRFVSDGRGVLLITPKWVFATRLFARVYA